MWNEVEPFYPDQTSGLPKTSESRGTESILDALILVWNDAPSGKLSADARLALDNMWALQFRSGEMSGSWPWLQFHNAPWEGDSQFYGTTLAAIAIGSAPGDYKIRAGAPGRPQAAARLPPEKHGCSDCRGPCSVTLGIG